MGGALGWVKLPLSGECGLPRPERRPTAMPLPFRKIALALTPAVALASVAATPNSLAASQSLACRPFVDFSNPKEVRRWRVVNDGVMGGLSSGEMRVDEGAMLYTGLINTNGRCRRTTTQVGTPELARWGVVVPTALHGGCRATHCVYIYIIR